MASSNPDIYVCGNIGTEITKRQVGNGTVVRFRVITNDRTKNDQGEWVNKNTSGWNVSAWDRLGEKVLTHLEKGDPVIIKGRIFEDTWTDNEGATRYSTEIRAEVIGLDVALAKS